MNKIATIAGFAVALSASAASAEILLCVDLSVENMITITATDGLASADSTSTSGVGFTLDNFFSTVSDFVSASSTGDLTTANEASDGSPSLWSYSSAAALNVYSFAADPTTTAGTIAFTGSATWDVGAADWAAALAGNTSGDIYMGTDNDDTSNATLVGQWKVVPAPGSMALLGLGGIVAGRRRR